MPYTTRYQNGVKVTDYWPDENDLQFFITSSTQHSLAAVIEMAKQKWGEDVVLNNIVLESESIQTRYLGYDLHDSSDYTDFIIVSLVSA
jgi:hypothetical protein